MHNYNRYGFMRADENDGEAPNYEPNSFGEPVEDPRYRELPYKVSGDVNRYDHRQRNDDYNQAGDLFRLMTAPEKKALISNLAGQMKGIPARPKPIRPTDGLWRRLWRSQSANPSWRR